jgi:hypothetical protein
MIKYNYLKLSKKIFLAAFKNDRIAREVGHKLGVGVQLYSLNEYIYIINSRYLNEFGR